MEAEATCGCCRGVFALSEAVGYPMATFCPTCDRECKKACKAHEGHDLRECRLEGCWRDDEPQ